MGAFAFARKATTKLKSSKVILHGTIFNAILLYKQSIHVTWRLQTIFNATSLHNFEQASNSHNVVAINLLPRYT